MDFAELATKCRKQKGMSAIHTNDMTLCFDPGHTTGWALFEGFRLHDSGELVTEPIEIAVESIRDLFNNCAPDIVVIEDYRVYRWRQKHHVGSEMLTTRVIGVIETFCVTEYIPDVYKQPASVAKKFCTDKKLREWGFYKPGQKHTRDAIRHGCYFLIFGAVDRKQQKGVTVG